jgi:hypothetical protein
VTAGGDKRLRHLAEELIEDEQDIGHAHLAEGGRAAQVNEHDCDLTFTAFHPATHQAIGGAGLRSKQGHNQIPR